MVRDTVIRLGAWAGTPKRPDIGEERDINGQTPRKRTCLLRGVFFFHISAIFRAFCLVVKRILLNLHTEKVLPP